MLLRDIHEFIPAGSKIVLQNPVSFEFNPHLVQALAVDMDADYPTIKLLFNGGQVDLIFNPRKFDQTRLKTTELIQIKNSIWDVAMHASKAMGEQPHADVRFGDQTRRTPIVPVPGGADVIPIKADETRVLAAAVASTSGIDPKMMERLENQGKEFETLGHLWRAYTAMPAVVDDDYPEMRHKYDACLRDFIEALRANGRLNCKNSS